MSAADAHWRPLLAGADAARAWAAIDRIAAALRVAAAGPSLDHGAAGRALFFAYLDRAGGDGQHEARWRGALDGAIDDLEQVADRTDLYGGFVGVAWAVEHLLAPVEDSNEEIDAIVLELLERWSGAYDLASGLCGFGVYAIERARRPSGRPMLASVVARLAESAVATSAGVAWRTRPEWLIPATRGLYPDGYHNLGLAHGVPAVALVLAAAAALDVDGARARPLARGAARYLLSPRLPATAPAHLPECAEDAGPARAAWCYGDPGAAAALLTAAHALGDDALAADALALARKAAARSADGSGVLDAGLCHGAAGLGIVFHQLHHASGDASCAEAARDWYRRALDYARDDAPAGFRSCWPEPDGDRWLDDLGLITGAAGIGLALLAAVAPVAPRWTSVLGLSLPNP